MAGRSRERDGFPPALADYLRAAQIDIARRWVRALVAQGVLTRRVARRVPAEAAVELCVANLLTNEEARVVAWLEDVGRLAARMGVTVGQAMEAVGLLEAEIGATVDEFYGLGRQKLDDRGLSHRALAAWSGQISRLTADAFHRAHERELQLALGRLAESQARYSAMVEHANDLVLQTDPEGRFVFVNARVRSVLGYEPQEMVGRHFTEFLTPESARRAMEMYQKGRTTRGHAEVLTLDMVRKDSGEAVPIELNRVAIHDRRGRFCGGIGIGRDVSAQMAERAARERHLQLRAIVGTVMGANHEINNPLASILTHVEIIRDRVDPGNADVQAALNAIAVQARRIADYTTRLRETARPAFVEYRQHLPMIDVSRPTAEPPSNAEE